MENIARNRSISQPRQDFIVFAYFLCKCDGPVSAYDRLGPPPSIFAQNPQYFVWVALKGPTPEELEEMRAEFDLHQLAVEDARNGHQRPKIEEYGDSLFAVLQELDWPWGYPASVIVMILIDIWLYIRFREAKWLTRL